MDQQLESNRKSLKKLRPQEAEKICVICYESPDTFVSASINCCIHIFCYECINKWATTRENTCPLCKQKFNLIKYHDMSGKPLEKQIEDKRQNIDGGDYVEEDEVDQNSEDFCYICASDQNPYLLMICDLCEFKVCHSYCAGFGNQVPIEDWYCRYCVEAASSEVEPSNLEDSEASRAVYSFAVNQEELERRRRAEQTQQEEMKDPVSESEWQMEPMSSDKEEQKEPISSNNEESMEPMEGDPDTEQA